MTIRPRQTRLLHVARRQLALPDDAYRSILVNLAGVTSSTELDQAGFDTVLAYFEWLGFKPVLPRGPNYGARPGMATFTQMELIRALWAEFTRGEGTAEGLNVWIERCFKVSSLRFLTLDGARKAITALKAMKARAA